jgi:release factor glutamine methyltransferase
MTSTDFGPRHSEPFPPVMAPSPLTELLAASLDPPVGGTVVDVGCGSGVLSVTAAEHGARLVYAIDTNPLALAETAALAKRAGCPRRVLPILADLCDLSEVVSGLVDTILCNPPQLPCAANSNAGSSRSAYDAGIDGRRYIRALIQEVQAICFRSRGPAPSLQLVTTSVADPDSTVRDLRAAGFAVSIVAEATAAFRPAYYDVVDLLPPGSYFIRSGDLHEHLFSIRAIRSGDAGRLPTELYLHLGTPDVRPAG